MSSPVAATAASGWEPLRVATRLKLYANVALSPPSLARPSACGSCCTRSLGGACKGMLLRQGAGKVKHLTTERLWVQGAGQSYNIAESPADSVNSSPTCEEMSAGLPFDARSSNDFGDFCRTLKSARKVRGSEVLLSTPPKNTRHFLEMREEKTYALLSLYVPGAHTSTSLAAC